MRGVAMSDLHLGKRQFSASEGGRNVREMDIEKAWFAAVDTTIAAQPDLVTIAGDIFEHARVGVHAIMAYRDGIRRITRETNAHVVVIQGNHDAGRTAEVLSPIVVPSDYERVHVVLEPKRLRLRVDGGGLLAVTCLPFVARSTGQVFALEPDPAADLNVLVIHAAARTTAEGADRLPTFYAGEEQLDIGREAERWDVIAVGDYHEYTRLHHSLLAFYSGSIERTSSNIWPEMQPKGVVGYDTESGDLWLDEVPTRPVLDYTLADFDVLTVGDLVSDVNIALGALLGDGSYPIEDAIVRLVVRDFPRSERDAIDWRFVRQLKSTCLHFQLDLHFAAPAARDGSDRRDHGPRSLMDEAADFFAADPADVRETALAYLGGDL